MKRLQIIFFTFLISCSFSQKKRENLTTSHLEFNSRNFDNSNLNLKSNGAYYTIVEFNEGTSQLSQRSKLELRKFLEITNKEGSSSNEIKILIFPDKAKISEREIQLADKRALSIKNYFKKQLKASEDILPFNLSNRPNKLQSFLESDDPRFRKVFEKTGKMTEDGNDLASLKENKMRKALILRDYE